ncbi:MAG TPA: hypothetical protein VF812_03925 [Ktedonobacterales bacterium]
MLVRAGEYRLRYKVERTFAWLGALRRLLIRWERKLPVYRGFFTLALLLVCLRHLVAPSRLGYEPAAGTPGIAEEAQ